jgi:hypothetical protein
MLLPLLLNNLMSEGGGVAPTITTTSLGGGKIGKPYSANIAATGDSPITWAVTVGVLPDGLSLNAGTGAITGTPTTEETQAFTVSATNANGTDDQELSITITVAVAVGTSVLRMRRQRGMRLSSGSVP